MSEVCAMSDGIIVVGNMMAFHGDMVVYKCGTNEVWKTIEDSDFICPDGSLWYCAKDKCSYQRSYCKAIPYIPSEGCGGADIKIGDATVSHCEYELDEVIENPDSNNKDVLLGKAKEFNELEFSERNIIERN
jgi:hypothetical protein